MRQYRVRVKITPWPEGGFLAEAPDFGEGCWVISETIAQAIADIHEGIEMFIESRLERGEGLPPAVVAVKRKSETVEFELPVTVE